MNEKLKASEKMCIALKEHIANESISRISTLILSRLVIPNLHIGNDWLLDAMKRGHEACVTNASSQQEPATM